MGRKAIYLVGIKGDKPEIIATGADARPAFKEYAKCEGKGFDQVTLVEGSKTLHRSKLERRAGLIKAQKVAAQKAKAEAKKAEKPAKK